MWWQEKIHLYAGRLIINYQCTIIKVLWKQKSLSGNYMFSVREWGVREWLT